MTVRREKDDALHSSFSAVSPLDVTEKETMNSRKLIDPSCKIKEEEHADSQHEVV